MICTLNNKTHDDLTINSKTYDYLNKGDNYTYHIDFKDKQGNNYNDYYIIRASIFTGDLTVTLYNNSNKNGTSIPIFSKY